MDFQRLLVIVRSSVRLGILGKERFQDWKITFRTLFRRPQMLPVTITIAIYSYHFRKICESNIPQ
jgi:hypothetical protein